MKFVMTAYELKKFMDAYSWECIASGSGVAGIKEDEFYQEINSFIKEYGDVTDEEFTVTAWPEEETVEIGCTTAPPNEYPTYLDDDFTGFARWLSNRIRLASDPTKMRNMTGEQIKKYLYAGLDFSENF